MRSPRVEIEPDTILLCPTCWDGCGWLWPMRTDGNADHDYVERCDECDRFAGDAEAFQFLVEKLQDTEAYTFDHGWAFIASIGRKAPYIDNVKEVE